MRERERELKEGERVRHWNTIVSKDDGPTQAQEFVYARVIQVIIIENRSVN